MDHEYIAKELFEGAVDAALSEAGVGDAVQRGDLLKRVLASAANRKVVGKLFSVFRANTPQLFVDLNRDQCQTMGVNPHDVFDTLQIYLGSFYVNDFNQFGRTWQVIAQADGDYRARPG